MNETPGTGPTSPRRGRLRLMAGAACAVLLAVTGGTLATSAQADPPPAGPTITINQTGTHDGYFYAFWKDTGDAAMTLGPGGSYRARWSRINNWLGGKGWATGGRRTFSYCGTFQPGGNSYLALFGYTRDPYIEYYIIENWGTYRPTFTWMGTITSEGSAYDVYRQQRMGPPGTTPYYQYFSIRQQQRSAGTINTGDHFDAWAQRGMNLGTTMGYMIMATEGYQSSGSSSVTVDSDTTSPPWCAPGPPSTPPAS